MSSPPPQRDSKDSGASESSSPVGSPPGLATRTTSADSRTSVNRKSSSPGRERQPSKSDIDDGEDSASNSCSEAAESDNMGSRRSREDEATGSSSPSKSLIVSSKLTTIASCESSRNTASAAVASANSNSISSKKRRGGLCSQMNDLSSSKKSKTLQDDSPDKRNSVDRRQPDSEERERVVVLSAKPLRSSRSFMIDDILSHKDRTTGNRPHHSSSGTTSSGEGQSPGSQARQLNDIGHNNHHLSHIFHGLAKAIVRPWDSAAPRPQLGHPAGPTRQGLASNMFALSSGFYANLHSRHVHALSPLLGQVGPRPRSADEDTRSEASSDLLPESPAAPSGSSPLEALFELANKSFDSPREDKCGESSSDAHFGGSNQNSKKKRKSRTAFTNHQIFELEKRFIYQKYLSPSDRDELALGLGLSNAQVITWFQNRRAKLKRDVEEIKKDMEISKVVYGASPNSLVIGPQATFEASKKAAELRALISLSHIKH